MKSYDKPGQCVKKQRHYFAKKGPYSQSYGPVVMYGDVRVGPQRRLSTEELMLLNCGIGEDSWEFLVLQRSNQSILKEINPEYLLEGQMLKLKLKYFGHLMQRPNLLEMTLILGMIEGRRKRGRRVWDGWMSDLMDMSLSRLREIMKDREAWCATVRCRLATE